MRDRFFELLSPELFCGVTLGRWWRILSENRFAVDARYWPRAAVTTGLATRNSLAAQIETALFQRSIARTPVSAPVFVLGIFRSGTTHLHNLLSQDQRFTFPTHYEVCFPENCIVTERFDSALIKGLLPAHRPQDGVALDFQQPHEDEVALCSLLGRTFLMDLAFPERAEFYRRYYTLDDLSPAELAAWKASLHRFLQKVSWRRQRPLILKSPGHTCRVRHLLAMYPDAKFVHIHRHPLAVYRSWWKTLGKLSRRWALQRPRPEHFEDDIIRHYRLVHDAWFRDRSLIPSGQLYELSYESLAQSPVEEVERLYAGLQLPDFRDCRDALTGYVAGLKAYRNNEYEPLKSDLEARLRREWRLSFEAWGYAE